jgi:hypothetical protein
MRSYTDLICGVEGSVFGLAYGAAMRAFRDEESFDIFLDFLTLPAGELGEDI